MIQTIKSSISDSLSKCGVDLRRTSSVPFGVRWHQDIQFFANGRKLETILDVGANTGQTALTIASAFRNSRVYSFEPVPSTFKQLSLNVAKYPSIEPICCALGADQGSAKMTTETLSETNTLVIGLEANLDAGPLVEVPVDTVDSFCAKRGLQQINLLKIDTEGYEMKVLQGSDEMLTLGKIDFILAECDFFRRDRAPHGDFMEIYHHLTARGFHVVSFYTGGVDNLGWMWGDVLFRHVSNLPAGRVATAPAGRTP
jgi:FkbM family methyltransferase